MILPPYHDAVTQALNRQKAIQEYLDGTFVPHVMNRRSTIVASVAAKPNIYDSWFIEVVIYGFRLLFEIIGEQLQKINVGDRVEIKTDEFGQYSIRKLERYDGEEPGSD